jgi:hypothetical protein
MRLSVGVEVKNKKHVYGVFFLCFLVFTSCVKTRCIRYEEIVRQPKPADFPIEIFESANTARPYKVIGVVIANAGKLHSERDTINHLRKEARKMGGDALMDLSMGPTSGTYTYYAKYYSASTHIRENWAAKVIVWLD